MTYFDRHGEARDRALRRSRAARVGLIGSAALASVGLTGAFAAGAVQKPATTTSRSGAAGSAAHRARASGPSRLLRDLRTLGSGQGLTSGSGGAVHTRTAGS